MVQISLAWDSPFKISLRLGNFHSLINCFNPFWGLRDIAAFEFLLSGQFRVAVTVDGDRLSRRIRYWSSAHAPSGSGLVGDFIA